MIELTKFTTIIDIYKVPNSIALFVSPSLMAAENSAPSVTAGEEQQTNKKTISGKVVDESGEPIPGAAVIEKANVGNGIVTDFDGNFTLTVAENATIVVNFIGYEAFEAVVTGKSHISVTLREEISLLDEIIVTGFQAVPRVRATGSAVVVNKDKLEKIQGLNVSQKLEGSVAGLSSYGGLSIRGTSSFAVGGNPLFVVDGQPVIGMTVNDLNPDDIENITILKDAAATSLYGVRASNGVIVVSTKRGNTEKANINVSANFYFDPQPSLSYQNWASTSDIIDYEREYLMGDPLYQQDPSAYFSNKNRIEAPQSLSRIEMLYYQLANGTIAMPELEKQVDRLRNNDYRNEYRDLFGKMKLTQDYNMSISKGDENSNLFFSTRYENKGSYTRDHSDDKLSFYLKNEMKITNWLQFVYGANATVNNAVSYGSDYMGESTFMAYETLYNQDGSLNHVYPYNYVLAQEINNSKGLNFMGYNAVDDFKKNKNSLNNVYLKVFTHANIKLMKELNLELKYQYEDLRQSNEAYDHADSYKMRYMINQFASTNPSGGFIYNIPQGGHLQEDNVRGAYYNFRTQMNYDKTFNEKHGLTALLGGEIRQDKSRRSISERFGYDDQRLTYKQVNWATLSQSGVLGQLSSNSQKRGEALYVQEVMHRYVSAYFNMGYSYDGRYSANASVRVEQADLFGSDPKYRYRPLWSAGGSWNISNEEFLKNNSIIDMLKLRATYGVTGNVDQNSSPFLLGVYVTSPYSSNSLTDIMTPPNRLLRWEKTSTVNVGADFGMWKKLTGSIEYYNSYSSDLLANKSLDPSTGFPQARVNNGAMRNQGVELTLVYTWLKNKDWTVTTALTAANNKNTIEKVGFVPTDAINMMRDPRSYYLKGDAFNSVYAYRYAGLTSNGNPSVYDANGNVVENQPMRDVMALVNVGQLTPKWNGAFDISVRWKSLDLFAKMVYYAGHTLRTDATPLYSGVTSGAVHKDGANRWTPSNTNTSIPSMGVYGLNAEREYHWKYADVNTESASFVKMRNIGAAYRLPVRWYQSVGLANVSLRAQINNPFYWAANKNDIDPEAYYANNGTRAAAQMTTYMVGVNINF